jgi:hypothetical protein
MKVKFAFCLAVTIYILDLSALALDPAKQAFLASYEEPFTLYLSAVNDLGAALVSVKTGAEFVKAADKFCDKANKFVDDFNANKERFANSAIVKSMEDDPDAKKATSNYLESLNEKLEDAKPILDKFISSLDKCPKSTEIDRIRDRVSATFQRLQLLSGSRDGQDL